MKTSWEKQETGANHTPSDSTAAIKRATTDRAGPVQALVERGCSITIRWTPLIREWSTTKWPTLTREERPNHYGPVGRAYLQEASLAHLTRVASNGIGMM